MLKFNQINLIIMPCRFLSFKPQWRSEANILFKAVVNMPFGCIDSRNFGNTDNNTHASCADTRCAPFWDDAKHKICTWQSFYIVCNENDQCWHPTNRSIALKYCSFHSSFEYLLHPTLPPSLSLKTPYLQIHTRARNSKLKALFHYSRQATNFKYVVQSL